MIQLGSISAVVASARSRAIACLAVEVGLRVHARALQHHWGKAQQQLAEPWLRQTDWRCRDAQQPCMPQL